MKKIRWEFKFAFILVSLSAVLYCTHFFFFNDINHIFLWSMTALAFLPINVLIVTLFVNSILIKHRKEVSLDKISMILGVFFSDGGTPLLKFLSKYDPEIKEIKKELVVKDDWSEKKFHDVIRTLRKHNFDIDFKKVNIKRLRSILIDNKRFFVRLIENPNLLEFDSFTNLLKAVFHLTDELEKRKGIKTSTKKDSEHLKKDILRVYEALVTEWIHYMFYLNKNCPYLLSISMRTNPFDDKASIIVK